MADVTITTKTNGVSRTMYMTAEKMCVTDGSDVMIFDAIKEVLIFVDPETKSVREMTRKDLEAVSAMTGGRNPAGGDSDDQMTEYNEMMEQARQQAMESIKDLPEDQRKMAEEEINKRLGGAQPPGAVGATPKTYQAMNTKKDINGYPCDGYAVMVGETSVGEVWTTPLSELKISEKDVAVLGKMRSFFESGLKGSPFMEEAMAEFTAFDPQSEGFIGFPVRQIDLEGGEKEITELVSVDVGRIDEKVFNVGSDYHVDDSPVGE